MHTQVINNRFLQEQISKIEARETAEKLLKLENKKDLYLKSTLFSREYRLEQLDKINDQIKELSK